MKINSKDSFKSLKKLKVDNKIYNIYSLKEAEKNGLEGISKLPKSIKILLENLLRFEDEKSVKKEQILSIKSWLNKKNSKITLQNHFFSQFFQKSPYSIDFFKKLIL